MGFGKPDKFQGGGGLSKLNLDWDWVEFLLNIIQKAYLVCFLIIFDKLSGFTVYNKPLVENMKLKWIES